MSVLGSDQKSQSPVRLRQIALVARDLTRARHELTSILGVPVIYEDPAVGQWGLENFLVPLGGDMIEVVSPTRPGTTAGRLLVKRGDGGYMIIMQTEDANTRRKHIESSGKSKVIFSHPFSYSYPSWCGVKDEGFCIQYHPKGIKGGVMPELDSHTPSEKNPQPLQERFSPWHACGPDFDSYVRDMRATSHLRLAGCSLRSNATGEQGDAAARQWSDIFDIPNSRGVLNFTNAEIDFTALQSDLPEGLVCISVQVERKSQLDAILDRARAAGKTVGTDPRHQFEMVGVQWVFSVTETRPSGALLQKSML